MGDDRLDQRERVGRHDMSRCWPLMRGFHLADGAKCADNLVVSPSFARGRSRGEGMLERFLPLPRVGEGRGEKWMASFELISNGNRALATMNGRSLNEEGPHCVLEGGDRAIGVGERGLDMGEHLRGRQASGFGRLERQIRRRTSPAQSGADLALSPVEPFPDALQGSIAHGAIESAASGDNAVGDSALEETPQGAGGEAKPSDFVGEPDADSLPATAAIVAVAAKESSGAHRLSPLAGFIESAQEAVPIQRADNFAVRTGRPLDPFRDRRPFFVASEKPSLVSHKTRSPKMLIVPGWAG
jgi:hypothetical protein